MLLKHEELTGSKGIVTGYNYGRTEVKVKVTDVTPVIPANIIQAINSNFQLTQPTTTTSQ